MLKFVILADDCTGALDASRALCEAEHSRAGISDRLPRRPRRWGENMEVASVALESRHLPPEEAYRIIRRAAEQAWAAGAQYIYKRRILPCGATSAQSLGP